jgi:outer membrane protein assembly factor BamD
MKPYLIKFSFLLSFAVLLGACSEFQKIQKSESAEVKYQAALKYYENKDWYKASLLFEELIPVLRGRSEAEQVQFYLANTHFEQGQYIMSSHFFRTFMETYPRSEYIEQASFLYAKSLYKDSPAPDLDQTSTFQAMTAIQDFLTRYPQSVHVQEADSMYNQLSAKVEVKAFENAKLYYQMRYYQAAVVAFSNFQREYPSSGFNEEAAYLRLDAQFSLAQGSVPEKQRERYFDAIGFYQYFLDKYPESKFIRSAENIYGKAVAQVEKLKPASGTTTPKETTTSAQ